MKSPIKEKGLSDRVKRYLFGARLYRQEESGRSMVEMLGVLAIIGVLSVGGIAGYTTAMNKHRANELLQQASLRAVVVSTQIQRGAEGPTLGEFTDNEVGGATFTGLANWNKNTDKRFSLTLENVPTEVCSQMKAMMGKNGIIREIDDNCTTITYNNDLSSTDPISSGNECTTECQNGATCVNGYCECPSGSLWQPSDNSGNGECKTGLTGDCTTNGDCKEEGKYCKITGKYENSRGAVPTTGTCTTLDNGTETTYNGKTFLYSSNSVTWWAARNWCLAHGMSLALLSDLGITGGYNNETGYCSGSNCTGADWNALKVAFGSSYYWTNNSHDSSYALGVRTFSQSMNGIPRYSTFYALCQ